MIELPAPILNISETIHFRLQAKQKQHGELVDVIEDFNKRINRQKDRVSLNVFTLPYLFCMRPKYEIHLLNQLYINVDTSK